MMGVLLYFRQLMGHKYGSPSSIEEGLLYESQGWRYEGRPNGALAEFPSWAKGVRLGQKVIRGG